MKSPYPPISGENMQFEPKFEVKTVPQSSKSNYTSYNSCERPKKDGYKPNHNYEVKRLNLYLSKIEGLKHNKGLDMNNGAEEYISADIPIGELYRNTSNFHHTVNKAMENPNTRKRGRQLQEKYKHPNERFSRKFFSEEKYHYSQNFQIEEELRVFREVTIGLDLPAIKC